MICLRNVHRYEQLLCGCCNGIGGNNAAEKQGKERDTTIHRNGRNW